MNNTKTLRNDLVSRITGVTSAGSNVFNSKVTPNFLNNLPAICVYTPRQNAESLDHRNPAFRRELDFQIEVLVAASMNWADTVDDIMHSIKTTLFSDSAWLGQFESVPTYAEEHTLEDSGEQPIAMGILTLTVELVEVEDAGR